MDILKPPALPSTSDRPAKGKLRLISGKVVQAVQETPDTWTLHIDPGPGNRDYIAGQFISIDPHQFPELENMVAYLEHVKGKRELIRAYSMASTPDEPTVSITTKPERFYPTETEYPPLLSPLLASNILLGRKIQFSGYTGAYIIKPEQAREATEVLHLVAGSGAVPNYAILKDELLQNKNPHLFHTLIDVNKTAEDIIYRDQLAKLAQQFPNRFRLIHLLTREENPEQYGPHFFGGRPSLELVSKVVKDPTKMLVYACGAAITKWQKKKAELTGQPPAPRFLETVGEIVTALGIDKKRFHREIYG